MTTKLLVECALGGLLFAVSFGFPLILYLAGAWCMVREEDRRD